MRAEHTASSWRHGAARLSCRVLLACLHLAALACCRELVPQPTLGASGASHLRALLATAAVPKREAAPKSKIKLFVGIMSSHGSKYAERRQILRNTYLRIVTMQQQEAQGYMYRFVSGYSNNAVEEAELTRELEFYKDFMRIPLIESYDGLGNKTRTYFYQAMMQYNPGWMIKVDDDVYVLPHKLPEAVERWDRAAAGYVGCMKYLAWVVDSPDGIKGGQWGKYHETEHWRFGELYPTHGAGPMYALSNAAGQIVVDNFPQLRLMRNEDMSMGSWMLVFNVKFYNDKTLCSARCTPTATALWKKHCAGLCAGMAGMFKANATRECWP